MRLLRKSFKAVKNLKKNSTHKNTAMAEPIDNLKNDIFRCEESIRILTEKIKQHQDMIKYYTERLEHSKRLIENTKNTIK